EEGELAAVDRQRDAVERHVAAGVDLGHIAELDDRAAAGTRAPWLAAPVVVLLLSASRHRAGSFSGHRVTPAASQARNSPPKHGKGNLSEVLADARNYSFL